MTRSDGLTKVILQGTVEGRRRRSRPNKNWIDNIAEWTGTYFADTQAMARNRQEWRELTRKSVKARKGKVAPTMSHTLSWHPSI